MSPCNKTQVRVTARSWAKCWILIFKPKRVQISEVQLMLQLVVEHPQVIWGAHQRFVKDPPRWDALMIFNSHLVTKIQSEIFTPPSSTNTQYSSKHCIAKGFRQWTKVAFLPFLRSLHQPLKAALKGYNRYFLEECQESLAASVICYRHTRN